MPMSLLTGRIHGNSHLIYKTNNPTIISCKRLSMNKKTFDTLLFSHGMSNSDPASHPACNSEGESDGTRCKY